ncbi:dolichyl-diphosphooligosaccharide--protein glycosyltransferase subunit TMEM258 [Festucalex cinctus]
MVKPERPNCGQKYVHVRDPGRDSAENARVRGFINLVCRGRSSASFDMELEAMTRYTSPVNPAVFPHLTVVLLAIGMFFTAWFFVYEVTSTKYTRDVYKELLISLVASLFMGFGVLFLLLWVGIYV